MKKLIFLFLILPTLCFGQLKISQLTANPAIDGTEEVPTARSGSNFKNSYFELLSWMQGFTIDPAVTPISVELATTAALSGTWTYDNGASGVGATLTRTTNGVFQSVDGVAAVEGYDYLFRNWTGANRIRNGVWTLTTIGTAGSASVLTRKSDSDEPSELTGQVVIPSLGNTLARRVFSQTATNVTVGSTPLNYAMGPASGGNIYSDGRTDFTATQTWDDGSGVTVAISPANIIHTDGGVTITTDPTTGGISVASGTNLGSYGSANLNVSDGTNSATLTGGDLTISNGVNTSVTNQGGILCDGAATLGSSGGRVTIQTGANGNLAFGINGTGVFEISLANVPDHADNAAATGAGMQVGQVYRTSTGGTSTLKIVE